MKRSLWVCGALLCVGYVWAQTGTGDAGAIDDWPNLARYRADNEALPAVTSGEKRVVFFGDSITDAWGRSPTTGSVFPGQAVREPGDQRANDPQMLVRFQQDVVHLHPAAVVILAGTNDIAGNTGPSTQQMIEDNFTSMAEIAKQNGIKVVLASITPAYAYPWKPEHSTGGANSRAEPVAEGFLLEEWIRLSGLLQLHGGCEGRHASGPVVGWRSPDGERVRRDGAPGGTCDCPGSWVTTSQLSLGRGLGEHEAFSGYPRRWADLFSRLGNLLKLRI